MIEFLTFLAILVALFGREFIDWLKKPILKVEFDINDKSYFHEIRFEEIPSRGTPFHSRIYKEGANCLLKISNPQVKKLGFIRTPTVENVEAKITYIFQGNRKYTYHPTNLNWSGGKFKPSVSIMAGSHHFLDFMRFYNYTALRKACKKAEVPYGRFFKGAFVFHDLRHTFNTNMRKAGIPESVIIKITGHSTREMFDRYNSIDADDTRQAVEQLGGYLRKCLQNVYNAEKRGPAETGPRGVSA